MMAMTMFVRLDGPLDALIRELETTPSSSRRAWIIRRLARAGDTDAMHAITPHLAGEGRVRHAAIEALGAFGEHARAPLLRILADAHRRDTHGAALVVLARIVSAAAPARGPRPTWRSRVVVEG